jgi:hypothetical protein
VVHAKEVFRIVLVFHSYEAIVIGTVRFAGNRLALVSGVVAVRTCECHSVRNFGEYEGDPNVDERLVADLIAACRSVAVKLDLLAPISPAVRP